MGSAERRRAIALPLLSFGAGASGMIARAAMWLDSVKPQGFYGTPSFALHLAEIARAEGFDPREFGMKVIDDMITIRSENVYPSEIDAVLGQFPDYGGERRIIITRERSMDELGVRVEATEELIERGADAVKAMREACAQRLRKVLGLRAVVEIVPPDTFPRTDFKARRVIDDREVFRQMSETARTSA